MRIKFNHWLRSYLLSRGPQWSLCNMHCSRGWDRLGFYVDKEWLLRNNHRGPSVNKYNLPIVSMLWQIMFEPFSGSRPIFAGTNSCRKSIGSLETTIFTANFCTCEGLRFVSDLVNQHQLHHCFEISRHAIEILLQYCCTQIHGTEWIFEWLLEYLLFFWNHDTMTYTKRTKQLSSKFLLPNYMK